MKYNATLNSTLGGFMMTTINEKNLRPASEEKIGSFSLNRLEEASQRFSCSDYISEARDNFPQSRQFFNEVWRAKVCEWFYAFIDHHENELSREVVWISMNLLDRYLAKASPSFEVEDQERAKHHYQIASMACLYLGCKVHYRNEKTLFTNEDNDVVSAKLLIQMGTAGFTEQDLYSMKDKILLTLQWDICPVTPAMFLRCLIARIVVITGQELAESLYQECCFLCELATCDYFFVPCSASKVAMSSLLCASKDLPSELQGLVLHNLHQSRETQLKSDDLRVWQNRLELLCAQVYEDEQQLKPQIQRVNPPVQRVCRVVSSEQLNT